MIQQPGCPNLYWALTDLASQPVDIREALSYEAREWEFTVHKVTELDRRTFTPDEALDLAKSVWKWVGPIGPGGPKAELGTPGILLWAVELQPAAREYLLNHGYKAEQIDAMPILQTVLLYRWKQYDVVRDDYFKWLLLPTDEARAAEDLPAVPGGYGKQPRVQQQVVPLSYGADLQPPSPQTSAPPPDTTTPPDNPAGSGDGADQASKAVVARFRQRREHDSNTLAA
jgi:hypothetical protein